MTKPSVTQEPIATERELLIRALRECAAFLEQYPQIPAPAPTTLNVFVHDRQRLATLARLTSWKKAEYGQFFSLRREFSDGLALELVIEREQVCRKVPTGTKLVPAQPEHIVETFEWVCDEPLLDGAR